MTDVEPIVLPEQRDSSAVLVAVAGIVAGILVGLMGGVLFLVGLALLCMGCIAGVTICVGGRLRRPFLYLTAGMLIGYAWFGRQFAYLGYPPLFIGDCVLALGLLVGVRGGRWRRLLTIPGLWFVVLFGIWGAARTVPYLDVYGLDALRDAVVWVYAIFAVLVAVSVRSQDIDDAIAAYGRWFVWLPAWIPCLFMLNRVAGNSALTLPWADVSLLGFKPGEAGVHLAGIGAFMALGLNGRHLRVVFWLVYLLAFAVVASLSRGGLLSIVAALGVAAVLGDRFTRRQFAYFGVVLLCAGACAIAFASQGDNNDEERFISAEQVKANISSVVGGGDRGNLDGTRSWRLDWWTEIRSYTLHGPYFWVGKGFGVNLADDDGFQVQEDQSLRSPHSVHMSILARTGVPGLLAWALLNVGFAFVMITGHLRARAAGQDGWARLAAFTLAYWLALIVNASFDVYFEGPSGGIWFWCVVGFGLAIAHLARVERLAVAIDDHPWTNRRDGSLHSGARV